MSRGLQRVESSEVSPQRRTDRRDGCPLRVRPGKPAGQSADLRAYRSVSFILQHNRVMIRHVSLRLSYLMPASLRREVRLSVTPNGVRIMAGREIPPANSERHGSPAGVPLVFPERQTAVRQESRRSEDCAIRICFCLQRAATHWQRRSWVLS